MKQYLNISNQIYLPSKKFKFLISHYIFLKSNNEGESFSDKFVPDGCMAIVMNFTGKFYVNSEGKFNFLPPYFLVSPLFYSLIIKVVPPADTMVIVFKTSVFARIFKLDFFKLDKKPYKSATIINDKIWDTLKNTDSDLIRIQLFESYLLNLTKIDLYIPDKIDILYEKIFEKRGEKICLEKLVEEAGLNQRTFRRQFLHRTGMNAKNLNRVVRINFIWSLFIGNSVTDYQSMVFEGNYYDQAHMIKDFKRFIGESPKKFFSRNQKLMRFISGMIEEKEWHQAPE